MSKTPSLKDFRRIVVKVGSSLLVDAAAGQLKRAWLSDLAADLAGLHKKKCDIIVVSSGAIALGRAVLKLPAGSLKLEDSQAAAAVGQIALARAWSEALGGHALTAGQVLVTLGDTEERRRYLNARSTIAKLLEWRSVPVINENDTVATSEIRYGDNDRLAARVATMMSADLLVLLSDVDGLYDKPPERKRRQAGSPSRAHHAGDRGDGGRLFLGAGARRHADKNRGRQDRHHRRHAHDHRFGPRRASACAHRQGRPLHLVPHAGQSGDRAQEMDRRFARAARRAHDRRWRGAGLARRQKSVARRRHEVEGAFGRGDAVVVRGPDGAEVGRGLSRYDAEDADKIKGRSSADISSILGFAGRTEMIHRDDLVLAGE